MIRHLSIFAAGIIVGATALLVVQSGTPTPNVSVTTPTGTVCDSHGFIATAQEVESIRAGRRVDESAFARMASEPNTVILDARSRSHFEKLHIKGSVNLPYTEFSQEALSRLIPNRDTRILIYCRNNFVDTRPAAEMQSAPSIQIIREFPYPDDFDPPEIPKNFGAGLNIPTFITLHLYGYRNVWELDTLVDPNETPIEFETGAAISAIDDQSRANTARLATTGAVAVTMPFPNSNIIHVVHAPSRPSRAGA
jgi:hypothetical protein